jgi:hypothetical protein
MKKIERITENDLTRIVKRVLNEGEFKPTDVKATYEETTHWKLSDTDGFNNLKIGNNISDTENHYKGGKSNKTFGSVMDNSIEFDFDSRVADGSSVTDVKVEFTNIWNNQNGNVYEVKLIVTYKNSGVRTLGSARTNITISNLPKGNYQLSNSIDNNNWLSFNVN